MKTNYEKLKEAKRLYQTANSDQKYVLESLFPELRKSEDERIRKAILELVRQSSEVLDKQNQNNMISWLERQGEQKPDEMIALIRDSLVSYKTMLIAEKYYALSDDINKQIEWLNKAKEE